ncbi:hypothetical protein VTJ83DRAFT_2864 [Remersonia thermophila]|uniref:Uncharacterized protein n=1 Tax=Remersonia thermophila TaxID=72144 RepID=A0ABR4DCF2_9PEZI
MLRAAHYLFSFILLLTLSPHHISGITENNKMCGMNIRAADIHGVDSFSAAEGTWAVPAFFDPSWRNFFKTGVALCCGDDCLMRLTAIVTVAGGVHKKTGLEIEVTPNFLPIIVPRKHDIDISPGDIVKFRVAVQSKDTAEL